uniref:Uncharacterized protein n=1 Tax=Ditylenchus dipsaci TaxID=166011 RepID=A0A915DJC4_9BILA
MANVVMTHSQRIGARTAPISFMEDRTGCYVWTKTGRTQVKDGIEEGRFICSGCRAFKLANGGRATLFTQV